MKKLNKKGFTLIELLAVIVIMGILMVVAIPAVQRTIDNSRKNTFISSAKSYATSASTLWFADELACGTSNSASSGMGVGTYYIDIDTSSEDTPTLLEQETKSPWGRDMKGYVKVVVSTDATTNKTSTKFYVAVGDGQYGVTDSKLSSNLAKGDIVSGDDYDTSSSTNYVVPEGAIKCIDA